MNLAEFKKLVAALPDDQNHLRVVRGDSEAWDAIEIQTVEATVLKEVDASESDEIVIEVY